MKANGLCSLHTSEFTFAQKIWDKVRCYWEHLGGTYQELGNLEFFNVIWVSMDFCMWILSFVLSMNKDHTNIVLIYVLLPISCVDFFFVCERFFEV
jgi:hypothetical protein